MTVTLNQSDLVDAVHDYLTVVVENGTMRAVSEADDDEIGDEVVEHYEHEHGPLGDERQDDVIALHVLGRYVVKLAREIVRSTTRLATPSPRPRLLPHLVIRKTRTRRRCERA